jgi:hypothetical protein
LGQPLHDITAIDTNGDVTQNFHRNRHHDADRARECGEAGEQASDKPVPPAGGQVSARRHGQQHRLTVGAGEKERARKEQVDPRGTVRALGTPVPGRIRDLVARAEASARQREGWSCR